MIKKLKYTAPAVLDDLALELEAEILGASSSQEEIDPNIEKVETMGQEVGGDINSNQWTSGWE